jgi:hypothetical protein
LFGLVPPLLLNAALSIASFSLFMEIAAGFTSIHRKTFAAFLFPILRKPGRCLAACQALSAFVGVSQFGCKAVL